MANRLLSLIGLNMLFCSSVLATNTVCSAFCVYADNAPKRKCAFVQISTENKTTVQAWYNLVDRCNEGHPGGGILVANSPDPTTACGKQTLVAATPNFTCFFF